MDAVLEERPRGSCQQCLNAFSCPGLSNFIFVLLLLVPGTESPRVFGMLGRCSATTLHSQPRCYIYKGTGPTNPVFHGRVSVSNPREPHLCQGARAPQWSLFFAGTVDFLQRYRLLSPHIPGGKGEGRAPALAGTVQCVSFCLMPFQGIFLLSPQKSPEEMFSCRRLSFLHSSSHRKKKEMGRGGFKFSSTPRDSMFFCPPFRAFSICAMFLLP